MPMYLYRTEVGVLLATNHTYFRIDEDWNAFVNDDDLHRKLRAIVDEARAPTTGREVLEDKLLPPIDRQEVWASGVTYYNSKMARQEESAKAGGGTFYEKVYHADRPELFFKATAARTVGSGDRVRIRRDSDWNVPEPELTLMITSNAKIVGYTVGNDMSSRSIEGENPLYLPQAKTYDGCAAVGPGIWVSPTPPNDDSRIRLEVMRGGASVFDESTTTGQIKRRLQDLVEYLFRECSFPDGCLLMTGTGIIPPTDFTLRTGDEIRITIEPIGTLINYVA